jgi:uncharacterized DUF497 family protein
MRYAWDWEKAAANERKHDEVSFYDAIEALNDSRAVDAYDERHSSSEHRVNVIGLSQRGLLFVVFTQPAENLIQIISARLAEPEEKAVYERDLFNANS